MMMVMHDLNLTAMCADNIVLTADGALVHHGTPQESPQDDLLSRAYGYRIVVNRTPDTGVYLLPQVVTAAG